MSDYKYSKRSAKVLATTTVTMQTIANLALKRSPIDFGIWDTGGRRSPSEQNALYIDGKSKCDGYKKLSNHQTGGALDIYAYLNGAVSQNYTHLAIIAGVFYAVADELGVVIRWGGTFGSKEFTGWDPGHLEIIKQV